MSKKTKNHSLTRRDFLKGGLVATVGAAIAKWTRIYPANQIFAQSEEVDFLPLVLSKNSFILDSKRIYIAPDDHTDYFWTAGENTYKQAFLETIDYYLDLADATASNIPEHQSRWNCDGSFWLWTYEKNKSAAEFQRLIDRIKSGHISVPLNALCICPGGAPTEAVIRGMYYPGKIERQHNLRFQLAYLIENQTLPYGIVSLFSGSGAKYSWKGICGCDSFVEDAWDREHEIYWWTGPDGSKMLIKWNSMLTGNQYPGGYAEARDPGSVVDYVDGDVGFIDRYPYYVIGAFGKGWDDLKTMTDEFVTVAKEKTTPSRKVIVSNEVDFFDDFEAEYGSALPSSGVSFGNEWDLYCAALSEVSARVKRTLEKLRAAEAMAALVSLVNPNFMTGRQESRDQAWMNFGLFWEHNFGMIGPPSGLVNERITWQKRLVSEIESYTNSLHDDAAVQLGSLIQKNGSTQQIFAFNSLNWERTDYADFPYQSMDDIHVYDLAANIETPSQIVTVNGNRYLRILAKDIPALGYKVFEIRNGKGQDFSDAASVNGNNIENQSYKITLAERGAITSLIDKTRGNLEIIKSIDGRYANDMGPSSGTIQVENSGPVTVTLRADGPDPLDHVTRVTLIRDSGRIDIRNDINQNFNDTYTFAFSFDLDTPSIWHEEVGAVIKAKLQTDGGHYSPRNARYKWLTLNHFADIGNGALSVTLSNADCYFMKIGSSTHDNLDTTTPQLSALIGGHVAGYGGLPDQGGDTHFLQRFALQTQNGFNAVSAMKFALEHQNPLVTGAVTGGNTYPANTYSFLSISNPNVLLWALKPADDGPQSGMIARFWNLDNSPADFDLTITPGSIIDAQRTTHIETPIEVATVNNGMLQATMAGNQVRTYAFSIDHSLPEPQPLPKANFLPVVTKTAPSAPIVTTEIATKNQENIPESASRESLSSIPEPTSTAPPTATGTPALVDKQPTGCAFLFPFFRRQIIRNNDVKFGN